MSKGCAFLSFDSEEAVDLALHLSGTKLRGRTIKVQRKRTNIHGMNKTGDPNVKMMNQLIGLWSKQPTNIRGKPRPRGK